MKTMILCILLAAFLCGCGQAEAQVPTETAAPAAVTEVTTAPTETVPPTEDDSLPIDPGDHLMRYDSAKYSDYLEYYLHIPEGAEKGMPLIIFLHGDGQVDNIDGLSNYGMMHEAREIYGSNFPFIAITPCTRTISWVNAPIPDVLMELINEVADTYFIDREKIIITGHSRGAIGTWNLISLYGDFFSAAVPVSCDYGDLHEKFVFGNAALVPIRAFVGGQGDLDNKYIPTMGYICSKIQECNKNADVQLTILWDHYHSATCEAAFTPELFEWMLTQ